MSNPIHRLATWWTEQKRRPAEAERRDIRANPVHQFEADLIGEDVHIRLGGEIDHLAAFEVRTQLLKAFALGPGAVHLDLRGVSFMGSPALNVFWRSVERLRSEKRPVRCVTNRRLGRLFEMCPLAPILNLTVED